MSSVGERAHTALQRAGGRCARGRAARRAAARGRPAHRVAVRAALLRGRRLLAVGLLAPLLGGRSSVMVMALLVLSIGIFPPRTSLWSASKSTTHVVRARNVDAGEQLRFGRCGSENQRRRAAPGRAQPRWRASAFGGVAGHAPGRAHRPLAPIGGPEPARPRAREGWWPTGVFVTAALYLSTSGGAR